MESRGAIFIFTGGDKEERKEEYTKITTPRQDVLFKKGYLSQKKPQSSVESASATTTPTASTNGTPDTQSTNGINSGKYFDVGEMQGARNYVQFLAHRIPCGIRRYAPAHLHPLNCTRSIAPAHSHPGTFCTPANLHPLNRTRSVAPLHILHPRPFCTL
ncbi:hypothetical protein Fcan01_15300 [Folsomia candida]|uniref:Uncharacterized protein n=1 Tax=Folsomia candida TaxID=158441 RepID=A0A226DYL2_FOLCA|nr:hypothetical protein Fcan01_15300 [Folsomia candida]